MGESNQHAFTALTSEQADVVALLIRMGHQMSCSCNNCVSTLPPLFSVTVERFTKLEKGERDRLKDWALDRLKQRGIAIMPGRN